MQLLDYFLRIIEAIIAEILIYREKKPIKNIVCSKEHDHYNNCMSNIILDFVVYATVFFLAYLGIFQL